ncbi:MAG: glycine--tRNA ligase subunit beta [bacterium]|nr:glycine--tRNA ligase subunit beta [bacterium]
MARDLLLEIGVEELPNLAIRDGLRQMPDLMSQFLSQNRIGFKDIKVYATPRRLAVYVFLVEERSRDFKEEVIGPIAEHCYTEEGKPTKVAIGFAKGKGVSLDQLKIIDTDKGKRIGFFKITPGVETVRLLPRLLPKLIQSLSFPKTMKWKGDLRFSRPIRWILCLFGEEIVKFNLNGIETKRVSFGHRFLSEGPIEIKSCADYVDTLKRAYVLVDQEERRKVIQRQLNELACEVGGKVVWDQELLSDVTNLVEYPNTLVATFSEGFLELPKEVLIASMCEHQRYFPLIDEEGRLLPHFLVVTNTTQEFVENIRLGNERVVAARLRDAEFFFREDKKVPLHKRVEDEKGVVFQEDLGTLFEKTQRLVRLVKVISKKIDEDLVEEAERSAFLCKADLLTEMVGEFPSLQGIMGYYYALASGEQEEVALAIKEHYLPRFTRDSLPKGDIGSILSMADKLDTIVGYFGVGLSPTGSEDPYGLRRAGTGFINIIMDKGFTISLKELIEQSLTILGNKIKKEPSEILVSALLNFFRQRIVAILTDKEIEMDLIEGVLTSSFDDPFDALKRARALHRFMKEPDFIPLVIAFKRVANILKADGKWQMADGIEEGLLVERAERELYEAYLEAKDKLSGFATVKPYDKILQVLAGLKEPIDKFFDEVMVMVEEGALRNNRLILLSKIRDLFFQVADFSYIQQG